MLTRTVLGLLAAVVVIVAVVTLGGLSLVVVQVRREEAKINKCTWNLRRLGQGVYEHQNQRGDLLPMGMYSEGISWAGLIAPYVNREDLAREIRYDLPYDAPPNAELLGSESLAYPFLYCPSRRQGPEFTRGHLACDYAVPSVGIDAALDKPELGGTWMQCRAHHENYGPMLLVRATQPEAWKAGESSADAYRYRSQTSFAAVTDGLAMQVLFGEKALHGDALRRDGKSGDFTVFSFVENSFNASGAARPGNGGVSASAYENRDDVYRYWGSWHPDMCQFAMGDGAIVRMNAKGSQRVLAGLCDRRDRTRVPNFDRTKLIDDSMLSEE